jgi:hypothetical protein
MLKKILICAALMPYLAHANFYIDMQKEKLPEKTPKSMSGYKLLTGDYYGRVFTIGEPVKISAITSEGDDLPIQEAMYFVLPPGWFAYIDEQAIDLPEITWSANNSAFLDVLAEIGNNHGLYFVVDWTQKLVQIEVDEDFEKPNLDTPVVISDSSSDREIYIYSRPSKTSGYILRDGKIIPVTVD